jgi:Chalcone isomerase-like
MTPRRSDLGRRRSFLLATAALALPLGARARATPAEMLEEWPSARLHGSYRLRFMGLHVYDIRLWTSQARLAGDDWARTPLALEIEYARSLSGRLIAERSIEEMRRSGPMTPETESRWLAQMSSLFPDVKAGDRITGVQRPGSVTRLFFNGTLRGEVDDADFTRRFFGIWLAPVTSQPRLRESLLGRS